MMEPFVLRALAAAVILALIASPLGCIVVWNRMAYFGETIAQAGLLGVALGLALQIDPMLGIIATALAAAVMILAFSRQNVVPLDSILGLTHHGALSAGVIATAALAGTSVDLMGYLFGDIFAVTLADLIWICVGGIIVLTGMAAMWTSLLRMAVHGELAAAEGVSERRHKIAFTLILALAIAFAIKIVGVLLVIAFLVVPAVAARPFSSTPETMVMLTAAIAVLGVLCGMTLSWTADAPGGPAIVLVMSIIAALSLIIAGFRKGRTG